MADKILGVFYVTASATGAEIPLPKWSENDLGSFYVQKYDFKYFHTDSVYYMFTDLHSGSMELVAKTNGTDLDTIRGTSIPAGMFIESTTSTTLGPFRLVADPPRHLYSPKEGGEPCRVTVVLVR